MIRFSRMKLCLPALVFLLTLSAALPAADKRPNILFIFTDDHAPHAIGAYGSKINKTPNMDKLAREGMIFHNSFCTNSICGPSRAVILTGKHSHLNGFMTNGNTFDGSQQTFPKLMRKAGYQTAMVGKWHLKTEPTGFDFWEVLIGQGPYYNPPMRTPQGNKKYTGYTTEIVTDIALDFLKNKRDKEKPFVLMYQHKAPHRNWAPGPGYLNMYDDVTIPEPATLFDKWENRTSAAKTQTMTIERHLSANDLKLTTPRGLTKEQLAAWNAAYGPKNEAFRKAKLEGKALVRWKYQRYIKDYLRCIAAVDDNIGRVLGYLDDEGLAGNTIVIYSSDQGFYLGDHGWFDKRWMYEESLRMPLIVRWPGVIKPGSTNHHLVQNLDYAETFLDVAGIAIPDDMQGRSLAPLFRGESPADWRDSIYYHYLEYPGAHSVRRHYGVRTRTHKLIRYYNINEWELFDLSKDPDELMSVHGKEEYASVQKDLEGELTRLQKLYADNEPEKSVKKTKNNSKALKRKARQVKLKKVLHLEKPGGPLPKDLDPSAKPLTVGAWCTPEAGDGVLIAHGGGSTGYSLYLAGGKARFAVRSAGTLKEITSDKKIEIGKRTHIAGTLAATGKLTLLVNGSVAAQGPGHLLPSKPFDGLNIGNDAESPVADYSASTKFNGALEDIRIYWGVLDSKGLKAWAAK